MSASAKKKLQKEQQLAQLTEKQQKAKKEAKTLKLYTTIFVVAVIVALLAGLVIAGATFIKNSGIKEKNTVAAEINGHEINSVELSYYYSDLINTTYNNWYASYGESTSLYVALMGLDLSKPLNDQSYSGDVTWADYFVDMAISTAERDYLLSDLAIAEGFTLTEESQATLDQTFDNLPMIATLYGFTDVAHYLRTNYGPGATVESYREYAERSALASDYYTAYEENLVIDDAAIRAYEADKFDEFSSFSYANYTISYSHFLTGGTEDADGNVTYTDEEYDAARAAAKAAAEALPQCATVEELNAAIATIDEEDHAHEATVQTNISYNTLNSNIREWMTDSARVAGDFTVVANEATTTDENGVENTVITGYTAYVFTGRNDNTEPMGNVRHILFNFQGGTTDENGTTTYSDEEKATALAEAEAMLALYELGDKTEQAFADLASANTDDTGSAATGGLYEDIAPVKGVYVESFTDWATDPARVAGETGIIESSYGYHLMYYVGDDEMTYRDSMIYEQIKNETIGEWYDAILATANTVEKDTSLLNKNLILAQ